MFVCVHKAFHATPNVYKRKSKEIHMETEPCGVDCFLLQVCQLCQLFKLCIRSVVHACLVYFLLFFSHPLCTIWRKGLKSLWTRICYDHRGLGGAGSSSVPPAPAALDHLGLLRKANRATVTTKPPPHQVGVWPRMKWVCCFWIHQVLYLL